MKRQHRGRGSRRVAGGGDHMRMREYKGRTTFQGGVVENKIV